MTKVKELRSKVISLINDTYSAKVGDSVYDFENPERIGEIIEKRPTNYSEFRIKWNDSKEENNSIRYGGTPLISCNYCVLINKDEIENTWGEFKSIQSSIDRINFNQFVADIKKDMCDADLKAKHKLSDDEYDYIIDSPYMRFAFS